MKWHWNQWVEWEFSFCCFILKNKSYWGCLADTTITQGHHSRNTEAGFWASGEQYHWTKSSSRVRHQRPLEKRTRLDDYFIWDDCSQGRWGQIRLAYNYKGTCNISSRCFTYSKIMMLVHAETLPPCSHAAISAQPAEQRRASLRWAGALGGTPSSAIDPLEVPKAVPVSRLIAGGVCVSECVHSIN